MAKHPANPFRNKIFAASLTVLAALTLASCAPRAKPSPPAGDMAGLEATAEKYGAVRVIAVVSMGAPDGAQPAMTDMRDNVVAGLQAQGVTSAAPVGADTPLIVAELTPDQLEAMKTSGQYEALYEDALAFASLADSGPLIGAPDVWALGGRGAGQAVAILDTGVDGAHPFLAGRLTEEACFSTQSAALGSSSTCPNGQGSQIGAGAATPCTASGCLHGTHVAGIAAGRGKDFSGMAPDADIVAIQVFSRFSDRPGGPTPCRDSGQASPCIASFTSDQIRALDHVRQLAAQRPIASANMSLGGGRATAACDTDLTKGVIDQLRELGVATVIAAGNDGFPDAVSRPGCISTAVTVGATSKQDTIAPFSNRGPQVDLLAPGVNITSSVPGGKFQALSGTSMATPHVAGAIAALKSLRPNASLDSIEKALADTGVTVSGRPRIAMLKAAQALPETPAGDAKVAAASTDPALAQAVAEIAAMPADRLVRVLVRARAADKVDAVVAAARAAGAASAEPLGGQAIVVVEAKPDQIAVMARSDAIADIQPEGLAKPQ